MLEHADRDDAVVAARLLAVVEQLEAHAVGHAAFQGAAARDGVLFLGEGDAGHVDAELLGEVQAHAAPARADVEHLLAGLQQQLGGDVALLVELGLLERLLAGLEVGAGILPVAVEEEIVELAVEVVVMGDVALRPARSDCTARAQRSQRCRAYDHCTVGVASSADDVAAEQIEQVVDVAVLDGELAVHVGFAQRQPRPQRQSGSGPPVMYSHA